jgi:hypothetical protein
MGLPGIDFFSDSTKISQLYFTGFIESTAGEAIQ